MQTLPELNLPPLVAVLPDNPLLWSGSALYSTRKQTSRLITAIMFDHFENE
jgi:hypothetical protein